ncbi:hypothetical protein CK203_036446 [Vitis vinifera]|uniref:Putative plant transposon protein domain-containing protein n=1 Tax=Vitis vinifera TaxID=29760 RepID=A0A438HYQ9_VITVI|nr:hypothetical protein CK203_036446 [Vitis vinifera]
MSKTPKSGYSSHSFQALGFSFQRRTLRLREEPLVSTIRRRLVQSGRCHRKSSSCTTLILISICCRRFGALLARLVSIFSSLFVACCRRPVFPFPLVGIRSSFSCGIIDMISSRQRIADLVALVVIAFLVCTVDYLGNMPPKCRRSKAPVKGSSSRTSKGARDENLSIIPSIQPPSIPKAPAKTSIDGIPFNAFPAKFCRDQYTKVYRQRSLVLERKLHLESFLDTPIPDLFVELGWLPLANFTGSACAPIVRMFYSNIIEHDLDESYLQSSLFGIVVKVTPKIIAEVLGIPLVQALSVSDLEITSDLLARVSVDLWGEVRGQLGLGVHTGSLSRPAWVLATFLSFSVYPSSHRANICKNGCILLSRILHREPINLASCILDEMIFRGDPTVSKKEVLPYGILITQICQGLELYFL